MSHSLVWSLILAYTAGHVAALLTPEQGLVVGAVTGTVGLLLAYRLARSAPEVRRK